MLFCAYRGLYVSSLACVCVLMSACMFRKCIQMIYNVSRCNLM